MTQLTVRRLLVDLETPVPRHWCGGDAFATALFNALSMSFPAGEPFFIDAVRGGVKMLSPAQQADWAADMRGFIGQEATHRRIHGRLMLWHSAEETEHKCAAFDLYRAMGGDHAWRVKWFRRVTVSFLFDVTRQTAINLRHDGSLWRWNTWQSAARLLFGENGVVRTSRRAWRDDLAPDFHPRQHDSARSAQWLAAHGEAFTPVGAG